MLKKLCIICFVIMMGVFSQGVYAFNSNGSSEQNDLTRSADMRIDFKGEDGVYIGERHFILDEFTEIYDKKGKLLSIDDIPVPCDVTIWYELKMDKDPLVKKIITKQFVKQK